MGYLEENVGTLLWRSGLECMDCNYDEVVWYWSMGRKIRETCLWRRGVRKRKEYWKSGLPMPSCTTEQRYERFGRRRGRCMSEKSKSRLLTGERIKIKIMRASCTVHRAHDVE